MAIREIKLSPENVKNLKELETLVKQIPDAIIDKFMDIGIKTLQEIFSQVPPPVKKFLHDCTQERK